MTKHQKKNVFIFLKFGISLALILTGLIILWLANLKIPDFGSFDTRQVAESTKIYDRTGKVLLYNFGEDMRRTILPSDKISRHIKNATVAIEDAEFYQHRGVKPTAIIRAALANMLAGRTVQGGSTITQQVIKNSLLTGDKNISRKLKEAFLALKLERVWDKDTILALYLNESPYGGNVYGVEEASQTFFGKQASAVTLNEAAYLAALPKAPTYYSPYGNHKEELEQRKNLVLDRMSELGFIGSIELDTAKKEVVSFLPQNNFSIKAPHFVFFVRAYLEDKYGQEKVNRGGLRVTTTLDWDMQKGAEEIMRQFSSLNEQNFKAKNAAVVGIDPKTGQILTMIGSRDYFETANDGNFNVTLARRQPGSAFKPFVYATAFKKGYTPDTVLFDLPTQFQTTCSPIVYLTPSSENVSSGADKCYAPVNYDGQYRGPVTLRSALAQSINIPSIETLYLAGINDSLSTAQDLGISTLGNASQYGLTLVLGGGEVTPLELTNAYAVFANDGTYNPTTGILQVQESDGTILEEYRPSPKRVLDEQIARTINDILSDNVARAPSFGSDSPLYFTDRDVAAKTGTTNNYRDMWTVGYSPDLVVGAWVGNNDASSMEKKVAGFVVAPMWRKIFLSMSNSIPHSNFNRPVYTHTQDYSLKPALRGVWQGGETYFVDKNSGKLATDFTPNEMREERVVPNIHNILYWLDKDNPRGPAPTNPADDPQFRFWEAPVQLWVLSNGNSTSSQNKPTEYDDVHNPSFKPIINITSPNTSTTYKLNDKIFVLITTTYSHFPLANFEVYLGGHYLGSASAPNLIFSFVPGAIQNISNINDLRVIAHDTKGNIAEAKMSLLIAI